MQHAAGAAPDNISTPGAGPTAAEIKAYMRRVDAGYDELHAAGDKEVAKGPKPDGWTWLQTFWIQFGQWKKFFADTIDDWIITEEDGVQTDLFGAKLDKARLEFKKVFGAAPGGDPVGPAPKGEPGTPSLPAALDSTLSLVKWGVIGYLAIKAFSLIREKDSKP